MQIKEEVGECKAKASFFIFACKKYTLSSGAAGQGPFSVGKGASPLLTISKSPCNHYIMLVIIWRLLW